MKLVLSWIFDHIQSDITKLDPRAVISELGTKTTEIARHTVVTRDFALLRFVCPIEIRDDGVLCVDSDNEQEHHFLPPRAGVVIDQYYLGFREKTGEYRWGTLKDLGGEKELLCPTLLFQESELSTLIPAREIVLEIDNNAISHRPDLWSHRGFAREIAAIFGLTLRSLESMIVTRRIITDPENIPVTQDCPFSITIENNKLCKRFAGAYAPSVKNGPSIPTIAARLALIDCRPIDLLVDYSNYVMFDLGQPIHAYDANELSHRRIVVRASDAGRTMMLLDQETITLLKDDIIVADGLDPIALAGVMGSADTAVTLATEALFIESANFQPIAIRTTAQRHKKRTEASVRFEKGIDPNQNVAAIGRYLFLLESSGALLKEVTTIQSVGALIPPLSISVSHQLIEKRLGRTVPSVSVQKILSSLGFEVSVHNGVYTVSVPPFRSLRDIMLGEDIIEEVGRMLGYMSTNFVLPSTMTQRKDIGALKRLREAKSFLSFGCSMRELHTYIVSDERFLEKIGYTPQNRVALQNPISAYETHLVTSLIPNLLRALTEQQEKERELRFYECARIFSVNPQGDIVERSVIAGVLFSKKNDIQFFEGKTVLEQLFENLGVSVNYAPLESSRAPWEDTRATARILSGNEEKGVCGPLASSVAHKLFEQGSCFYFEFAAEIVTAAQSLVRFVDHGKYPASSRDFSLFIPLQLPAAHVKELIKQVDGRIRLVECIDFFEKAEWSNHRSATFRVIIQDETKTLLSEEVEFITSAITAVLRAQGIEIR